MTLMPQDDEFERVFPSSFVLLRPREDVSGDFYWVREVGSKAIVVVADCTGHGIPGAFMSILGITLIQMITKQFDEKQLDAALILSLLQKEVIETMKVSNEARARKDGMDISLCVVDKQRMTLQFAGAFSDLWVVRSQSQQVMKIKGVKMPVGIHQKYYEIINHDIQLSPGDTIYLLTDGYKDQFGGNRGKRFMSKNLEELVLSLQRLTMTEQRKYLSNSFIKWKNGYTQVDDMLIIGIKF
jgi:serine phosphatase RsbU (regulator of sigma subunit)